MSRPAGASRSWPVRRPFSTHIRRSLCAHPGSGAHQVCLAVAASRTSPVVDDFFTAAQATAEITAECGNY